MNKFFRKIIFKFRIHRRNIVINSFLKKKKKIRISEISKRKDYSDPFYMTLLDDLLDGIGKKYLRKYIYPKILEEEKNTIKNQKTILSDLLKNIKNTKIWEKYWIPSILNESNIYQKFTEKLPIFDYDTYKTYIEEAKEKENIVRPDKILQFSASSGTTSNKKHIPVSSESLLSASKAGICMFAEYSFKNPNTKIFKWEFFPLTWTIQYHDNNITIADVSALLLLDRWKFAKNKYALDLFQLLHSEREIKREIALKYINPNKPITMMWITSRAYEILNYIQQRDAKMFDTMIKNMEVIFGGGVDVAPYMQYFKKLNLNYMWVYNASEWYFWYQDIINYDNSNWDAPYKLLTNHWIFYEFLEFNSNNFDENWNCKKASEIKAIRDITKKDINKKFALIITTNSGLLRYMIWDVIQFVDENLRYKITGRTRQSLNLKWEELMETHIGAVIQELSNQDKINIIYYTIWPDQEENPTKHQRVVETDAEINVSEQELAQKIDKILQKINADYKTKRNNDILLKLPQITLVPQWTFYQRLKKSNRLWAQIKVPKLSSKRNYIKEVLRIVK